MITSLPNLPAMRIGDVERQQAVGSLAGHLAAGRLSLDEYDERIQLAYAARTTAELAPLFGDLPATERPAPGRRLGHQRRKARGQGPSPVLLIVLPLLLASIALQLPLFLLIPVLWFRGAHRRRHRAHAGYSVG